jgi:hypothetical protein
MIDRIITHAFDVICYAHVAVTAKPAPHLPTACHLKLP